MRTHLTLSTDSPDWQIEGFQMALVMFRHRYDVHVERLTVNGRVFWDHRRPYLPKIQPIRIRPVRPSAPEFLRHA